MQRALLLLPVLLLLGCAGTLRTFEGWSIHDTPDRKIVVQVGRVWSDRREESLFYAAYVVAQRGYRFFTIQEEDGRGESGTQFAWRQNPIVLTHVHNPSSISEFSPGSHFTIIPVSAAGDKVIDSAPLLVALRRWRDDSFP